MGTCVSCLLRGVVSLLLHPSWERDGQKQTDLMLQTRVLPPCKFLKSLNQS